MEKRVLLRFWILSKKINDHDPSKRRKEKTAQNKAKCKIIRKGWYWGINLNHVQWKWRECY
jgi:hypothetical protein